MKYPLLALIVFVLSFFICIQSIYSKSNKEIQGGIPIRDRRSQFTPYELYPWRLRSCLRLLDLYKKEYKYDSDQQNSEEGGDKELLKSRLRMDMRSLINERNDFVSYALRDKSLSAEQKEIIQKIQKISFLILQKKDINELTIKELIESISDEAITIGPMVKKFMDKREAVKELLPNDTFAKPNRESSGKVMEKSIP